MGGNPDARERSLHVVRYYPRALVGDGGMTGSVRRWARALTDAGAQVTITYDEGPPSPPREPPFDPRVRWRKVHHLGPSRARVPVGLSGVVRGGDLLVLHSGWTAHNLIAGMVARRAGVPYLLEPRGAYDPHIMRRKRSLKRLWWALGERTLVQRADAIHVFFEAERAHLEALGYRGPVVVASNGLVQPDDTRWDGGSGGFLLWLGRFDPEHKGIDLLLRAMAILPPDRRPQLRLHGPDWRGRKATIDRGVAELGLRPWVTIGPAVYGDAKRKLLARCGAFVYPSRWDACPNSVLEATSMGVPTVVTPYPLGRFLAGQGAAILAEPEPAALARALPDALAPGAAAIGARAAEVLRDHLAWDRVADAWLRQAEAAL